jgi:hypothetical protein
MARHRIGNKLEERGSPCPYDDGWLNFERWAFSERGAPLTKFMFWRQQEVVNRGGYPFD